MTIEVTLVSSTQVASRPTFSVVICNFNYEKFIASAIESALKQTVLPKEIVVVDDGSTDGSLACIEAYRGRVQILAKANQGQISAYNAGFDLVTSDYVIFLDSDDLLDSRCVESLQSAYDPEILKYHWRMNLVDAEGAPTGGVIPALLFDGVADRDRLHLGVVHPSAPGSGNAYQVAMLRRLMPLPLDSVDKHGADFFATRATVWLGRVKAMEALPLGAYRIHSESDRDALVFGNAAKKKQYTYQQRVDRFKAWFTARYPEFGAVVPASDVDFSIEKQRYAVGIFGASSYFDGVKVGAKGLGAVFKAIRYRDGSALVKVGLLAWAVFVLLVPRQVGLPVARYVCNPARRT
jgi:glycosyltransferase involved in cell wall biosynthesis